MPWYPSSCFEAAAAAVGFGAAPPDWGETVPEPPADEVAVEDKGKPSDRGGDETDMAPNETDMARVASSVGDLRVDESVEKPPWLRVAGLDDESRRWWDSMTSMSPLGVDRVAAAVVWIVVVVLVLELQVSVELGQLGGPRNEPPVLTHPLSHRVVCRGSVPMNR